MRMNDSWDDDPELSRIVSPLSTNPTLRAMLDRFAERARRLASEEKFDGADVDAHNDEVERVADHLSHRDYEGGFDAWDWAASFLTDDTFRDLYSSDRHDILIEFICEDTKEYLMDRNWLENARTQLSRREVANLLAVLSRIDLEEGQQATVLLAKILESE